MALVAITSVIYFSTGYITIFPSDILYYDYILQIINDL